MNGLATHILEPSPPERMPSSHRVILRVVVVVIGLTLTLIVLTVVGLGLLVSALWPDPTVVASTSSPDGRYTLTTLEYDHGALGGEVVVRLEGTGVGARDVAVNGAWGERPHVAWEDSVTYVINGTERSVETRDVLHLDD